MDRLDFAIKLARKVGLYLLQHWGNALNVKEKSSFQDIVSDCDKRAQQMILSEIERHFPKEAILAEEDHFETGQKLWIVDPIDGTMNFVHGLPSFAVGIAYSEGGNVLVGVVHDPVLNETFYAVKNEGAYKNGEKISVSSKTTLKESIGNVGFYVGFTGHFINAIEKHVRRMRMAGSAVLAASYVACGRFDFFVAKRANPWDVAPVLLIVPEAGGYISDFEGRPVNLSSGEYLFSNGKVHSDVLEIIKKVAKT
ncbi:MAG: Inositol-phosphate phosphatase [Thermotoga sp. 50_1627]|uniref:inositol monophosphatase family protein n=1 Tax=Pseudothermotoga sp. TaxID=2033661 RepID=UPI00076D53D3|nr:MAG: Inositol-phosphate phosphatase [Thermotoga sp. 50_64]KUK25769.1 MAG: Inositol-phosphate phosphatase [Thermotoga sp. 50_1627]MBC7115453.1 inositol monophosphatase [Pseudothermotoga sp.]MDK2922842.1 monophosphatase [Pseudothermotoga sp.]HBT40129.1 inositol monophosphatase [Pseudothermotoga sp.]